MNKTNVDSGALVYFDEELQSGVWYVEELGDNNGLPRQMQLNYLARIIV